jgi:hypothetical protein
MGSSTYPQHPLQRLRLRSKWATLCLGFVFVTALAALAAQQPTQEKAIKKLDLPPGLAYLPASASCYTYTRVHDLAASDLGQKMRDAMPTEFRGLVYGFQRFFGLDMNDIASVTVFYPNNIALLDVFSTKLFDESTAAPKKIGPPIIPSTTPEKTGKENAGDKAPKEDKDKAPETKKAVEESKQKTEKKSKKDEDKTGPPDAKKEAAKEKPKAEEKSKKSDDKGGLPDLKDSASLEVPANSPALPQAQAAFEDEEWRVPGILLTVQKAEDLAPTRAQVAALASAVEYKGKTYHTLRTNKAIAYYFVDDVTVVRGPASAIRRGLDNEGRIESTGRLQALVANRDKHVWLDATAFAAPNSPTLQFPAFTPLTKIIGKQIGITFGLQTQVDARIFFDGDDSARKALGALNDFLAYFRIWQIGQAQAQLERYLDDQFINGHPEKQAIFLLALDRINDALRWVTPKQDGQVLEFTVNAEIDMAKLAKEVPEFVKTRRGDAKVQLARSIKRSQINLQQISAALRGYFLTLKSFPPWALCDKDGNRLLSWRVLLLPYLDEGELFNQFNLGEPWDSVNNIKLLSKIPRCYMSPRGTLEPGHTIYQGFVGKGAGWEWMPDPKKQFGARGLLPSDIKDGLGNTIVVAEAGESVPWTKPADMPFDADKPMPKIGGIFDGGTHVLMFDGKVLLIRRGVTPELWQAAITRQGGDMLPADWYR